MKKPIVAFIIGVLLLGIPAQSLAAAPNMIRMTKKKLTGCSARATG